MSKNTFEILFQTKIRVKALKFIFRNPDAVFSAEDLSSRIQEPLDKVVEELEALVAIKLIKIKKNKA